MREVTTIVASSPEEAFRLLEDPRSFERLVAGARKVRRFDARWPEEGTVIHHTVGIPPLLVRDTTEVQRIEQGRLLCMEARIWPLGTLLVEFEFSSDPAGCRLAVREAPRSGPIARPGVRRIAEAAVTLRNREICRRYRRIIDNRNRAGASGDA